MINSSYSFQWIILKPCILVVDILTKCLWIFYEARTNLTELQHIELSHLSKICIVGYGVCVINSSYTVFNGSF